MADPKEEEKIEKKLEETSVAPKKDGELSEADVDKVAGGNTGGGGTTTDRLR
jgi:hypothetical protein